MSIVSVDNIQPIGSGTSVTVNNAATLVLNNVNSTGVVTASSFVGGLPITNGADNRVITATSASAIQGEANLTFDGTTLTTTQLNVSTGANSFETSANVFKGASGQKGVYLRSALSSATTPSYSSVDDTNTGIFLPGSDVFAVTTGGTERLRIDSNGNVTKPNSFHILVDRDGNQTGYSATGTTGAVIWNRVRTAESSSNAANHFNVSTGIFTAPVTGLYFFHASVNCSYNVEGAWLIINGSRPNFSVFYPNGTQSADGTITYHLTAGDEVGLKWYDNGNTNGTINSNALHTWWRIVLLG